MVHANARKNLFARRLMVQRVAGSQVAEQLGVSRATVHKRLRRRAGAAGVRGEV